MSDEHRRILDRAIAGVPLAEIAADDGIDTLTARTRLRIGLDRAGYARYTMQTGLELARIAALRRHIIASQHRARSRDAEAVLGRLGRMERRISGGRT